jgi:hypothetical protein
VSPMDLGRSCIEFMSEIPKGTNSLTSGALPLPYVSTELPEIWCQVSLLLSIVIGLHGHSAE